jgi:multidrug transporter EmrE-like cation transporter
MQPDRANGPEPIGAKPLMQLAFSIGLVTASEVLLKRGAAETLHISTTLSWLGITSLTSPWVWLAIGCILLSLASWLYVLKHVDLAIAYTTAALVYALVPVASWVLFSEQVSAWRWLGIGLIVTGLAIIIPDAIRTDQQS